MLRIENNEITVELALLGGDCLHVKLHSRCIPANIEILASRSSAGCLAAKIDVGDGGVTMASLA